MHVVVSGATGLIGRALVADLLASQQQVTLLTRKPAFEPPADAAVRVVGWQPPHLGDWASVVDGADAVVNLAGSPVVATRWTAAEKTRILQSRLDSTRAIVDAIGAATRRPAVLVNASAIGFYGSRGDDRIDELTPRGSGFLADVCVAWEAEARRAEAFGVRVALARTGVVLAREGGAVAAMAAPFRWFVGGTPGDPNVWLPWIHLVDEVGLLRLCLENEAVTGPINLTAPEPVQMKTLAAAVARALNRPNWAPVPPWALRLILGERFEGLFASLRVEPRLAERLGYRFHYRNLDDALRDTLQ